MIKGLQTDRPGLPRAGIIRLGYKKTVNKGGRDVSYPVEADHFVLTDAPGVVEALGQDKPTELNIYFPFDLVDLVFPSYMQHWIAGGLVCRGDGEHIIYAIDPTTGKQTVRDGLALVNHREGKQDYTAGCVMACPGVGRDLYPKCIQCKPNAMLIVLLRDVPRLAYYQIATTSIHNIVELTQQLNTCLDNLEKITGKRRLTGVPFILKRIARDISVPKPNGEGRMRTKKYLLQLEIDSEWVMNLFAAQRQLADPMRLSLPAPTPPEMPAPPVDSAQNIEPPLWDAPADYEEAEIVDDVPVESTPAFLTIDDLLFQLNQDFGLSETEAKEKLHELNFFTIPKNGEAKTKLTEMYQAVKAAMAVSTD